MILDKLFFILYTALLSLVYLLALPFLYFFSKRKVKYKESIPARFLLKNNKPLKEGGIWFHVCSFGEARAIYPLLDALPDELLRLSTTTQTGHEAISLKQEEQSRYLPFEPLLFSWIKPQKVLLVMEAEFWYLLFALAKSRGAKTMLINARMSDRSFPKYRRISWLYKMIFRHIDEVYAQSELDKKRLELLGAKNVQVIGNIKLADTPKATKELTKPKNLLVCAASTHHGEEALILDAFVKLKKEEPEARLIVVPRHPERFEEVSEMVKTYATQEHYTWHKYSDNEALNSDIIVADVLGELVNIYAISDVVVLGGAFAKVGGHNAAEAAQFGCKIISGKYYFNQRDIFSMIEGIKTVIEFDLATTLIEHEKLIETRITQKTDINPILESIKKEL
ncbi:MAG: Lipid IVA 3-deoxy-D-manno-octulosonic acid transferase (EC [often with (EC also] [uncultured Sulfurovum sp.]|uniref:3-deoxy-D-manno-octulosonic acid transferase n=1 Tax=uncultured Sulfurovum sp. TaxID=269237 RepID=A0A6S6TBV0_9BACT|nr:MAG: Lipid IVA 3-deoxy-D-manno-octulosonic acid transferase (EC [often with (EC also] [uncultured Sulfurovum sp.]